MNSHISIRPASSDDSAFIAWAIQESSRSHTKKGFWDLIIPEDGKRLSLLERLTSTEAKSFCHYSGFLIAEVEAKIAAALSFYTHEESTITFTKALLEVLPGAGWTKEAIQDISKRTPVYTSCLPSTEEGTGIIEWVAVVKEYRGMNLASALIEKACENARDKHISLCQASVLIGNTAAIQAFERCGFSNKGEKRSDDFKEATGCPGIARYQRALD